MSPSSINITFLSLLSQVVGANGRFFNRYAETQNLTEEYKLYFPLQFMILVKMLQILFPITSDMEYSISDLSVISSVGDVQVQGPHFDTVSDSIHQNMSFLYSLNDSTSLIVWDRVGNNTLYPTRVHVSPGSLILFHGNTIHSGSDHNSSTPDYRLHGYIDNIHVSHGVKKFGLLNFNNHTIRYDALAHQP